MRKITFLALGCLMVGGCIPLMIGAGVLTGYALSGDSASGNVKSGYRTVWDACLDTLEEMEAEIVTANESKGLIRANISEYNLTVRINMISHNDQRLKVSARRYLLPKPHFAQKVFLGIMDNF